MRHLGEYTSAFEAWSRAVGGHLSEAVAIWVPGRVEILGKHTDYSGGRSLLCAIDRGFRFAALPRADRHVTVRDLVAGASYEEELSSETPKVAGWENYPATVLQRVVRNFGNDLRGVDIALASDLPSAAGLSSSSALMIGIFLALSKLNGLERHPAYLANIHSREALAHYLGCIENGSSFGGLTGNQGVGTSGGSQDHTAILCCEAGAVSQYSFCPVLHEATIPLPEWAVLLIVNSGVRAEKTGAAMEKFNAVSRRAHELVRLWNEHEGDNAACLREVLDRRADAGDRLGEIIAGADVRGDERTALRLRMNQYQAEANTLIPAAAEALRRQDWQSFRTLVSESQYEAETHLQNQIPETIAIQRRLISNERVLGASAFGAGFGGSVWALVHADDLDAVRNEMIASGLPAEAIVATRASGPARYL